MIERLPQQLRPSGFLLSLGTCQGYSHRAARTAHPGPEARRWEGAHAPARLLDLRPSGRPPSRSGGAIDRSIPSPRGFMPWRIGASTSRWRCTIDLRCRPIQRGEPPMPDIRRALLYEAGVPEPETIDLGSRPLELKDHPAPVGRSRAQAGLAPGARRDRGRIGSGR